MTFGLGPYAEFKTAQSFWVQLACCISILVCMSASTVYHTYGPLSRDHFFFLLKIDLMGIGFMIFGLTLAAVFIGFHNWEWERTRIMIVMASLMVSNLGI